MVRRRRAILGCLLAVTAGIVVLGLAVAILVAVIVSGSRGGTDAITTARGWARLDPLPASASPPHVVTLGSAFTREFRITFSAPPVDIDAWLASSPGTRGVTPERTGQLRRYTITPGSGAAFAEVTVDDRTDQVTIHTYWS